MKIPRTPPPFEDFLRSQRNPMPAMQGATEEARRQDRYLHWDELRHREPPEGISVEDWWFGLKWWRLTHRQFVPLKDKKGEEFHFWLTPRMFEWLHDIDLRCGGSVEGPGPVFHPATRDRYHVSSLVEEAITSSQLEGAVVTRSIAREMLRSGRGPTDTDERMILNNYLTMRQISEWKDRELSPDLVMELHRSITRGTLDDPSAEGRLRRSGEPVRVEDDQSGEVVHDPPPASELPNRLQALCDFANAEKIEGYLHPVARSIILHFWLAYDHPFVDGNGRAARAVFYWSMLRHGFWLFEFISISQTILEAPVKYYRAFLHTETDHNDLNYFLLHQLEVIERAIDRLHRYIRDKSDELARMHEMLDHRSGFNHRQLALLRHALEHPEAVYTVTSHRNSHGVVPQTARNDLDALTGAGLLAKAKVGKAFCFRPVKELAGKLDEIASRPE